MSTNDALVEGIAALRAGDRQRAQQLLQRATQLEPNNERAWLWLAGAVPSDAERRQCLERVLVINPANEAAQQGLAQLGPAPTLAASTPPVLSSAVAPAGDHRAAATVVSTARPRRRRGALVALSSLVLLLVAGVGAAWYLLGPSPARWVAILTDPKARCGYQSQGYVTEMFVVMDEWDDANKLANQTGRVALAGPVAKLQEVRRRALALEAPTCAAPVKQAGAAYMDAVIDGYIKFMAQDSDSSVNAAFETAQTRQDQFTTAFLDLTLSSSPR